jgi:ComF family protein
VLAQLLAPPLCWGCGGPARRDDPLCGGCRRTLRHLPPEPVKLAGITTWAPISYEGAARELVRGLKFRGAMALADPMAALIVANAPEGFLQPRVRHAPVLGPPALVPVPLHPARRRRRGFNQAAVLAAALARRTGLVPADCLTRSGPVATQVGRPRSERLATPPGGMQARAPVPARVVVVDDVATTGATLAASARTLCAAGALEVRAVTFARTLGR